MKWQAAFLVLIPTLFIQASQAEELFLECMVETEFSLEKGERAYSIKYVFQYNSEQEKLLLLKVDDRAIAIHAEHVCKSNPTRIFCERYDFGTYWLFQVARETGAFEYAIGEYSEQDMDIPRSYLRGSCSKIEPPKTAF